MSCIRQLIRYSVGIVETYIRNSVDSRLRMIISSRQSPKMSACKQGLDFVPLLNTPSNCCTLSIVFSCQLYFHTVSWSSSSRNRSPSHQMPKFTGRYLPLMISVLSCCGSLGFFAVLTIPPLCLVCRGCRLTTSPYRDWSGQYRLPSHDRRRYGF